MNEIERIWVRARDLYGDTRDRRAPTRTVQGVLLVLLDGPTYGSDIARRAGQLQHNVTYYLLPKLELYRFVEWVEDVPGVGHQGGGRNAVFWALTRAGKELAELLTGEVAA